MNGIGTSGMFSLETEQTGPDLRGNDRGYRPGAPSRQTESADTIKTSASLKARNVTSCLQLLKKKE
jgi:hypothetical protein